ncbi:PAS domain-containing protein [Parvibaculum sp.]|uniref:PAS domain-containing protein n=1 Tax=Parvibaculum sp. TaxID=2024848 RepID=UPI00391D525A
MLSSGTNSQSETVCGMDMRSPESTAFQQAWEASRGASSVPARSAIDLRRFAPFAPWFAIIEPDPAAVSLPFRLTGSGFRDFFGHDLTGVDYLTLADPAIRQHAYDCVMACLRQPCGLWQSTPATTAEGGSINYEYTILPISKSGGPADHIGIFVNFESKPFDELPGLSRIEHSTLWHWLDIGHGVPPASLTENPPLG